MTAKIDLSPAMQAALEQWAATGSLDGVHGNTVKALERRGVLTGNTVAEQIGNAKRYDIRWYDNTLFRASPTKDARRGDYAFWDKMRKGLAVGYEIAGAFLKPLESKVSAWTLGNAPKFKVDNPDTLTAVAKWWQDNHSSILKAFRESVGLGDCYLVFNGDSSVTVVPPHVVTPIVNEQDYSEIVGYVVSETHSHPQNLNLMTIEDRYTAESRERRFYRNGTLIRRERYRNPLGRIPVIHIGNNSTADEVHGRPEGQALLKIFEWYNEIMIAALQGNIRQGRPTPVMSGLSSKEADKIWDNFGVTETYYDAEGNKQTRTVIPFYSDELITTEGDFKYAQPGAFAGDTEKLLGLLFYLILQYTEIPEFIWGNAIASSMASAESQMPAFAAFIEGKQSSILWWVKELVQMAVAYHAAIDPAVNEDDEVEIGFAPLTGQDGKLTLEAIKLGVEKELLDRETALRLMPLDIDDPQAVLDALDDEMAQRQADFDARMTRQAEEDTGFTDPSDVEPDMVPTEMLEAKYDSINFGVPSGVRSAARRALRWIADGKAGDGFTDVGRRRAADLARDGYTPSPEVVRRMKAYFDRHQSDKQATGWKQGEQGYPTPGRVAWDAWGGDAGYAYARRVVGQMDAADERESAPALTVVNEAHSGVMVAFMLPASARVRLARMAREAGLTDVPPGEYHVTLAYLGEMDAIADKREAVQTVVNYYAESMPPVVAKISGMGRFSETHREGMDAIYASVDSPQLPAFRQGLVDALVDMGVPVAMDHGFTPHVTLGYIPEEADTPNLRVRPVDVTFDRLTLAWGDEMTNVDMMTEDKVA